MSKLKRFAAVAALAAMTSVPASAATISYFTGGSQDNIPGLTGFATSGDQMVGMGVTVCFSILGCESRVWAATGPGAGGVTGTGWSLTESGDTFNVNAWTIDFGPNQGQIISIALAGGPFTLFDRTAPAPGTPGSANGRDFDTGADGVIHVTYIDPVAIIPDAAVGDVYHNMLIEWIDGTGPRQGFSFSQDADNDVRLTTPEPTTLALLGIGALGLALSRRRQR
jgi:hypothetical protein